jgi:hypothetical protein
MGNIYNQTDMSLKELKYKLLELENYVIEIVPQMENLWLYHPSNPNSINPIQAHKQLSNILKDVEIEICMVEELIKSLESTN